IQFSGGRTSGYLLRKLLDRNRGKLPPDWKVCFENTGKERFETLAFIEEVSVRWGVDITWLEFNDYFDIADYTTPDGTLKIRKSREPKYKIVNWATASRNGEPFEKVLKYFAEYRKVIKDKPPVLPNPVQRLCTAN